MVDLIPGSLGDDGIVVQLQHLALPHFEGGHLGATDPQPPIINLHMEQSVGTGKARKCRCSLLLALLCANRASPPSQRGNMRKLLELHSASPEIVSWDEGEGYEECCTQDVTRWGYQPGDSNPLF